MRVRRIHTILRLIFCLFLSGLATAALSQEMPSTDTLTFPPDQLGPSGANSPTGQHYPTESAGSSLDQSLTESSTFSEGNSAVGISELKFRDDEFFRAQVKDVETKSETVYDQLHTYEVVYAELLTGKEKGEVVTIEHNDSFAPIDQKKPVKVGETIVLVKTYHEEGATYAVMDQWRLPPLGWIAAGFLALVIWFGRRQGAFSILGLVLSILILAKGVVPLILKGYPPFWVSLGGASIIAVLAIYLAHGLKKRTSIAVAGTLLTLGIAAGLATFVVELLALSGMGTEEAIFLNLDPTMSINLKGILLGGIVIGVLGVLDDITPAQSAVVDELKKANPALTMKELYHRGLSVGREHIASLVNTLVLAYAGASFPLFLLFTLNNTQPAWMILNSEFIAEEIVRTLIGSSALILAVPLTTALAAWVFARSEAKTRNS